MEKLISVLGCGRIELMLKQSAVYFVVVKFIDIFEKIILLPFGGYPIKGVKALDYPGGGGGNHPEFRVLTSSATTDVKIRNVVA